MIQVVRFCFWQFGPGNMPGQSQVGQVTECRADGVTFYVRENLDNRHAFYMNGGARWRIKGGNRGEGRVDLHRQCLELCAPADQWERLAELVRAADPLGRKLKRNRTFTVRWAEARFAEDLGPLGRGGLF